MPVYLSNILTNFFKNILAKVPHFIRMIIFLVMSKVICAFSARYIDISKAKDARYTTKHSIFLFNIALTSFFLSMNSTFWLINRTA